MTEKNGDLKYKTDNAIDEAYRRGYEDGLKDTKSAYNEGLKDAWEWARKIMIYKYPNGISDEQIHKIFDTVNRAYVLTHLTAHEVMQKIKDYEERQTEEIKVGDEVKVYDDYIGIVTRHAPQARTCYVMYRDGSCGEEELTDCKKTGNHSMSLDKWLEQMRKERK